MGLDVLIFSASYGGGHQAAALALKEGFNLVAPELNVEIVDYIKTFSPRLNRLAAATYSGMVNHAPFLWSGLYHAMDKIPPDSRVHHGFRLLSRTLPAERLIERLQPRLIVSTYFVPARIMAMLKRKNAWEFPLATVITDQTTHNQWLIPGTNLYLVGSEAVAREMRQKGIGAEVVATGIPIAPAFVKLPTKREARRQLGLKEDWPVILLMGGAEGMMQDLPEICSLLDSFPMPVQIEVVVGRDEKTRVKAAKVLENSRWPSRVHGFVNNVPQMMAAAEVLISKAGGLTSAEAMASGLPMLIYKPIPGQEKENADLLIKIGAAWQVGSPTDVKRQLLHLLTDPRVFKHSQEAARDFGSPSAALEAARRLKSMMEQETNFRRGNNSA